MLGDGCDQTCNDSGSSIDCDGFGPGGGTATCWRNDGLYCHSGMSECATLISLGQHCKGEGCVNGAYCFDGTCIAKLETGGDCSTEYDACADGFYCDNTGSCQKTKAVGDACSDSIECEGACGDDGKCAATGLLNEDTCAGTTS
jgi:hypothetical protein